MLRGIMIKVALFPYFMWKITEDDEDDSNEGFCLYSVIDE